MTEGNSDKEGYTGINCWTVLINSLDDSHTIKISTKSAFGDSTFFLIGVFHF